MQESEIAIERILPELFIIRYDSKQWTFGKATYIQDLTGREIQVSLEQLNNLIDQLSIKIKAFRNTLKQLSAKEDEKKKKQVIEQIRSYRFCQGLLMLKRKNKFWASQHIKQH